MARARARGNVTIVLLARAAVWRQLYWPFKAIALFSAARLMPILIFFSSSSRYTHVFAVEFSLSLSTNEVCLECNADVARYY